LNPCADLEAEIVWPVQNLTYSCRSRLIVVQPARGIFSTCGSRLWTPVALCRSAT
jgi:hypothetical protein